MIAQKEQGNDASAPKYDPHTETKMKGTVEEVRLPPKGNEKEIAHLLVKNMDAVRQLSATEAHSPFA